MQGAKLTAAGKWSMPADATGLEDGFEAVNRIRGVTVAWDKPISGRVVISAIVFEPNDASRLEVMDGVLGHFIQGIKREDTPQPDLAAGDVAS